MAGSNKGQTHVGDLFNNPFALRNVDSTYTSSAVEENGAVPASGDKTVALKWGPVIPGTVSGTVGTLSFYDDGAGKVYSGTPASRRVVMESASAGYTVDGVSIGPDNAQEGKAATVEVVVGAGEQIGTITYGLATTKQAMLNAGINQIYDAATPVITFTSEDVAAEAAVTTHYNYNNVVIP